MNPTYAFSQGHSSNSIDDDKHLSLTNNNLPRKGTKEALPELFNFGLLGSEDQGGEGENFNLGEMQEEETGIQRKVMPRSQPLKKKQKDNRMDRL